MLAIFSFNNPSSKGFVRTNWNGFTTNNWSTFFNEGRGVALFNSIIIAFAVSALVVSISLFTCYGMWRQKNRAYSKLILGTNNVPLINPDNISAIGLALLFSALFGALSKYTWRSISWYCWSHSNGASICYYTNVS